MYVPIVPTTESYMHLTEAPVTFLMGLTNPVAMEDRSDICILDIDSCKLVLPEDLPELPGRGQLIASIRQCLSSVPPTVHLTAATPSPAPVIGGLQLDPIGTASKPAPSGPVSLAQRRANRGVPKLKVNLPLNNTPPAAAVSDKTQTIRSLMLNHFASMLLNYAKFVIFPRDRAVWESNRDNQDNFEKDVFLCDQAECNLTFFSRFLESHMFSVFVDNKILINFGQPCEAVSVFDSRIEETRKSSFSEIKSPVAMEVSVEGAAQTAAAAAAVVPRVSQSEVLCRPPDQRGCLQHGGGGFPVLRKQLLADPILQKS